MNSREAAQLIRIIAEKRGSLNKKRVLAANPGLQPYLVAAYHPFKKYHIRQFPVFTEPGKNIWSEITWALLNGLSEREITGDYAKGMLYRHMKNLEPDSRELLIKVLKHDLRMGVGITTINAVFPDLIPVFGVMLASKLDWDRVQYPIYTSPKLDGVRAYYRDGNLYTRSGHTIVGCDHIIQEIRDYEFHGFEFDGELMIPGEDFNTASGKIRSLSDTPDAVLNVFDIPSIGDRPFRERETALVDIWTPHVHPVRHYLIHDSDMIIKVYDAFREVGYEGAVLKTPHHLYQRKRSFDWIKMKAIETLDLPCVDYFEGTGKYEGQLGGIIVDNDGVEVRVGSGFSDDDRQTIWNEFDTFRGIIAEVAYQEITPDGSLRHPRFIRWRWDKDNGDV